MDPNQLFSRYRDDAFAEQLSAAEYSVFVAMPFRDKFSYRSRDVYERVIKASAARANEMLKACPTVFGDRRFGVPKRIDDQGQTARSIGDEIIKAALFAHVVMADLTFANDGVMLEVGASLALKPTSHIVLITQGHPSELHFDITGNVVIPYSPDGNLDTIAGALVAAVRDFESRRREYLSQLSRRLSRDSIWAMNWFGQIKTGKVPDITEFTEHTAIFAFWRDPHPMNIPKEVRYGVAATRVQLVLRELIGNRLLWSDYKARHPQPGEDSHAYHGTKLGWQFISSIWDDLQCPTSESRLWT